VDKPIGPPPIINVLTLFLLLLTEAKPRLDLSNDVTTGLIDVGVMGIGDDLAGDTSCGAVQSEVCKL